MQRQHRNQNDLDLTRQVAHLVDKNVYRYPVKQ